MSPSLLHPPGSFGVADKIEQPTKKRAAVTAPKPEPSGVRSEGIGECARVVVDGADGIRHHVSYGLGILAVIEEIGHDAGGQSDGQAPKGDPLVVSDLSVVKTQISSTRLPPARQGELVSISGKMAESVQRRCRPVRDHPVGGSPFPRDDVGSKLQPRSAKLDLVRCGRTCQVVHTLTHSLQDAFGGQALEGGWGNARIFGLTTGN